MNETVTITSPDAEKEIFIARELVAKYIKRCQNSIRLAVELDRRNVTKEVMSVPGMCAAKNRMMINHLCGHDDTKYLEVGTHVGAMFTAALAGNKPAYACGIDNFSEFAFPGAEDMFKKHMKEHVKCKYDFFNRDCFDLTKTQKEKLAKQKINTYLYDGPHSREDHIRAMSKFVDVLDTVFIYIVDDWNDDAVRRGTFQGLKANNIRVWWQIDLKANVTTEGRDLREWWNGVWVGVCSKRNIEAR